MGRKFYDCLKRLLRVAVADQVETHVPVSEQSALVINRDLGGEKAMALQTELDSAFGI